MKLTSVIFLVCSSILYTADLTQEEFLKTIYPDNPSLIRSLSNIDIPQIKLNNSFAQFVASVNCSIWDIEDTVKATLNVSESDYQTFSDIAKTIKKGPRNTTLAGRIEFLSRLSPGTNIVEQWGSFLVAVPEDTVCKGNTRIIIKSLGKFALDPNPNLCYHRFAEILLSLPSYDSYHYLLNIEALSNLSSAYLFNDNFLPLLQDYARRHHATDIPYLLMHIRDFDPNQDFKTQLEFYEQKRALSANR